MGNFHISKRKTLAWYTAWAIRGCAIFLALLVCAVVTTALTGEDPIAVYKTMFSGAFGTPGSSGPWARTSPFFCASLWP